MKVVIANPHYCNFQSLLEMNDPTISEIYKTLFSSSDQTKEVRKLAKRTRDPKFFQKLIFLLTGIQFEEETSKVIWDEIEKYHKDIVRVLGRNIHITATTVEYMLRVKHYLKNPSVIDLTLAEKTEDLSLQDFLTGLYKGSLFEEFIRREINRSKRHGHTLSILLLQVNGLESMSISGNISVATKVIMDISSIIKYSKRAEDIGFRFSVSKFGIMLPQTDKKGAILFAKRLITEINTAVLSTSGLVFGLSLSVGIQTFPEDGDDAKTLVSRVEKTCYKSKTMGPNRVAYEL